MVFARLFYVLLMIEIVFYTSSVEGAISAGAISAAASSIIADSSLAGATITGMMKMGYRGVVGIEVENWTKYILANPNVQLGSGRLKTPPVVILPGRREAMVARKTGHMATGSNGTVSWKIESGTAFPSRLVVIMWAAPFNFDHFDNRLGIGLTTPGHVYHPSGNSWFDLMYYREPTTVLRFTRKAFNKDLSSLMYEDDKFQIVGIMGSSHQAEIKIQVLPKSEDNLAPSIKALMK